MIEMRKVSKSFTGKVKAVRNINLTINDGEFVFIIGHSGAGKSTLIKMLMHEEVPTSGELIVNEFNVGHMRHRDIPHLRRTLGVVFQDFRLIPNKNVFENVAFAMRVIGASAHDIRVRVPKILHLVNLSDKAKRFPDELSGGEQQRVALARALVNNPSILIADEPTGNLDPDMSLEIMQLLMEINRRGTTVLVVTHEQQLVNLFDKRVVWIEKGRIVSDTHGGAFDV
ncbi:MAG: cell division ATP-binding protein FtsE [Ruminococcaceae bacterium]|nr:cell division ATP-binding protein FtsE [Oscillospiraceae bacterium]